MVYAEGMTITSFGGSTPTVAATVRIATHVRELMARHQLVQGDLQQVLGLSQTGVSKRLRGITPFDVNELEQVAQYFNMTLAELVREAEEPKPSGPQSVGRRRQVGATRRTSDSGRRRTPGYPLLPSLQVLALHGRRKVLDLPRRLDGPLSALDTFRAAA